MLSWAFLFLMVTLLAALLGYTGIAGTAAGIAQTLFVLFLCFFLVAVLIGRSGRHRV
jgi:uncharacterized membrane protein YtjA (UPF0391 family)